MISNLRYWFLLLLVLLVYVAGMFVTLFEQDSARFAVMAMHMAQENDFVNLLNGNKAYLVKPHLHIWFSAFSFKIFGLHDWAYRIPGVLATLLAAYSCFGLGKLLYNSKVGKLAALVFITAQIIVVSNTDVRIDTLLTGFSIFALWQFVIYLEKNSLSGIILGSVGAGLAFSTAGLTGLLFIALPLFCHLVYTRKWKMVFNWKIVLAILLFCISVAPVLYAYYLQIDSHSEQIATGQESQSEFLSLFWERISGPFIGNGLRFDTFDFYFFKNFLWTFLPWSIIGLLAYVSRFKTFLRLNFGYNRKYELLSLGGVTLIFLVFTLTQYRSIHYLNSIMPLMSILVASYLYGLNRFHKTKHIKTILSIQYFIFGVIFIVSAFLCYYVFKADNPLNYIWKFSFALLAIFYSLKREAYYYRLITVSVLCSLMINAVLNTHTFPELLKYQAGSSMAEVIAEKEIPTENIYKPSELGTWALDFYNKKQVKQISINQILNKKNIWVYTNELQLRELSNLGYDWDRQYQVDQFRMGHLNAKFLDPVTRKGELNKMYLIHIY